VQQDRLKEKYDEWLQNDGILLVDKQLNKSFLTATYHEKVPGTTMFVISDHIERREVKEAMAVLGREIKTLQGAKKQMADQVNDVSKLLKALKEREQAIKERNNTTFKDVIGKVEEIFQKYHITKPYYHGGKYNGKAMCTFMTSSSQIMDEIHNMIVNIP